MTTLLVGTRKGLFVVEGVGGDARVVRSAFVGDNVPLTLVDRRDGAWYAALDHGHFGPKLHRSDDAGITWEEITLPTYPPKPEDLVDKDMWGRDRTWTTKNVWSLEPALDASGALWCGTGPGGLFRSEDRGATWSIVESLWNHEARTRWSGGGADDAVMHTICVDPRDPRTVAVAISSGGVWRSRDAGATWEPCTTGMKVEYVPPELSELPENQDPHRIAQCPGAPEVFWCQHHVGIFRSTDDLASWHPITAEPSSFGFPVVVHPTNPDTAWFVPAHSDQKRAPIDGRVVVTRTRDGGKTFEVLSKGLPQENAFDLVYRHALSITDDGQSLAFGSTTGNLFASDDQGDSWHVVANHLPPIYSVRFA